MSEFKENKQEIVDVKDYFDIIFFMPVQTKWLNNLCRRVDLTGFEVTNIIDRVVTVLLTYPNIIDPIEYIINRISGYDTLYYSVEHTSKINPSVNFTNKPLKLTDTDIKIITDNISLYLSIGDIDALKSVSSCYHENVKNIKNNNHYWKKKLEYEYSMISTLEYIDIKWSYIYGIFTTYIPDIAASIFIFDYRIVKIAKQLSDHTCFGQNIFCFEYKKNKIKPARLNTDTIPTCIFYAAIKANAINTFKWLVNSIEFKGVGNIIQYITYESGSNYNNEYIDILMENKNGIVPPLDGISIKLSTKHQLTDDIKEILLHNALINDDVMLLKYQINRYNINHKNVSECILKLMFKLNLLRCFEYILEFDDRLDINKLLKYCSDNEIYKYYPILLAGKVNPNNINLSIITNILMGKYVQIGIIPLHYILSNTDINIYDYINKETTHNKINKNKPILDPTFSEPLDKFSMLLLDPIALYKYHKICKR
jgi:hypothetical protein